MQAVNSESTQILAFDQAEWTKVLDEIWQALQLLQDKLMEYENRQSKVAEHYGMLVRRPYLGYRSTEVQLPSYHEAHHNQARALTAENHMQNPCKKSCLLVLEDSIDMS